MADAAQATRLQSDAWDDLIEHWLAFERRRVNRGYVGYDDWQDEEVERAAPLTDVSVGEILEHAIGVERSRWTKSDQMRVGAYLKAAKWERYRANSGGKLGGAREWRYRMSKQEKSS
jgi:hypothetical protein